jgi:hypothetical protein
LALGLPVPGRPIRAAATLAPCRTCSRVIEGTWWREASGSHFCGAGSWGNGVAMRAAPRGVGSHRLGSGRRSGAPQRRGDPRSPARPRWRGIAPRLQSDCAVRHSKPICRARHWSDPGGRAYMPSQSLDPLHRALPSRLPGSRRYPALSQLVQRRLPTERPSFGGPGPAPASPPPTQRVGQELDRGPVHCVLTAEVLQRLDLPPWLRDPTHCPAFTPGPHHGLRRALPRPFRRRPRGKKRAGGGANYWTGPDGPR